MRFSQSLQILLSISTLTAGAVIPRDDVDPENPEASDPKTPPSVLNRPARPDNPFKDGFKTAPASCTDFEKPSEQCIAELQAQPGGANAFSGGELKWDSDHQCSDFQKGKYQTAAWDAHTLAVFSDREPDAHNPKDIALWKTWMGPDYATQQKRISDNFKRASGFLSNKAFDIILSCKDTKNYCPIKKDGKAVGGYAREYYGWFGTYYYITMCQPFFQSDDLMYKIDQIEDEMAAGKTEMATKAEWQKNTGQMFLHEMMHLNSTGQPHVKDEHVDPDGVSQWAYGPTFVHMLARRQLNQGGGATRASTNADSYSWLANSRYFYELTGYFPRPPNYKVSDESVSAEQLTQEQNGFLLDIGTITEETASEEISTRLDDILAGFGNPSSSSPKPSKGKSLSIAMTSIVNSHSGGATIDSQWNFFTTSVGKAVGSCGETDGEKLTPSGGSDIKISGDVNLENPPWPAGEYKLNIEGQDCEYKSDGTNAGRLFCPDRQISCVEDGLKSSADGKLNCGSRAYFHAAVYCDF
ncbi:hypothetical protein NX059_009759 [Plenodomus lindquistii]|nr:hypothetical protein NX059_009759 [Plenodomus lindquistii]